MSTTGSTGTAGTRTPPSDVRVEHRPPPLSAGDVMTSPVVTITADDNLWSAWELLYRGGFRHLVVADGDHCVGVLDDRRIVLEWPTGPVSPHRKLVRDILPGRVHCVLPETPVSRVAEIMLDESVDAVPVVSGNGRVLGLLTATDLIAIVAGRRQHG